jgi:hypothetical protein
MRAQNRFCAAVVTRRFTLYTFSNRETDLFDFWNEIHLLFCDFDGFLTKKKKLIRSFDGWPPVLKKSSLREISVNMLLLRIYPANITTSQWCTSIDDSTSYWLNLENRTDFFEYPFHFGVENAHRLKTYDWTNR